MLDETRPYSYEHDDRVSVPFHRNHPHAVSSSFVIFITTILLSFVSPPITLHSIVLSLQRRFNGLRRDVDHTVLNVLRSLVDWNVSQYF